MILFYGSLDIHRKRLPFLSMNTKKKKTGDNRITDNIFGVWIGYLNADKQLRNVRIVKRLSHGGVYCGRQKVES